MSAAERSATASVLNLDVVYNSSDKNYGPVQYSKELSRVQCQLQLEDARKGTYQKIVDETKEDILQSILLKLRSLLCRFKERGALWDCKDYLRNSIIREASNAVKGGRLCAFYTVWKLHKAASASGLRTRLIAAAINYVTGPASQSLNCQLQSDIWKHPHMRDLIKIVAQFCLKL